MGLDTTHGAFNGAYSAFNRLRQAVAEAAGGSYPPHKDQSLDNTKFYVDGDSDTHEGVMIFLSHSDCDGGLSPTECQLVADGLSEIVDKIHNDERRDGGHLASVGGAKGACLRFIEGCKEAAKKGETLEFH